MKFGSSDVSAFYLGGQAVSKIYLGSTEVWSAATGPTDTGWLAPSAAVNLVRSGSVQAWVDPTNIFADDTSYAAAKTISLPNGYSDYLVASGFGASVPGDATILGIEARYAGFHSNDRHCCDDIVSLVLMTFPTGSNLASSNAWEQSSAAADAIPQVRGGAAELWGLSLSPADVNESSFGIAISIKPHPTAVRPATGRIDWLQMKIHYQP